MSAGFVERTLAALVERRDYAAAAESLAASRGWLQQFDPRFKLAGVFSLILATVGARRLTAICLLFAVALTAAAFSLLHPVRLLRWVWLPALLFTGVLAAPAAWLTPGRPLPIAAWSGITWEGARSAAFLIARAETAATLSALLVLTTAWPALLKALRVLRCPAIAVAMLGMTYRYIFLILETAAEMMESRRSRTVGTLSPPDRRRLAAASAGVLLERSLLLADDVHLAMQSRGYRGEVYLLDEFRARLWDWFWLAAFLTLAVTAIGWGR